MAKADIGLWGLAVMGQNLALNMADKGFAVAVYNRTRQKIKDFIRNQTENENIIPAYEVADFIAALARPRKVMLMVKAGKPVDTVIEQITPFLEKGDLIIDGGNSRYTDTITRCRNLTEKGLLFIGTGISGGEAGALNGPSIMPGGTKEAYTLIEPIFTAISAKADGIPCCDYVGNDGAGHFVKMVHNGIEYADMQLIAEVYYTMKNVLGTSADKMHKVFAEWNKGPLSSYLVEITADILATKDPETGNPLVEMILDKAAQKGTGAWTVQSAVELGVAVPTISQAVFARCISAIKSERSIAAKQLTAPQAEFKGQKNEFIIALHDALYASKICSYAQGFALMAAAAKQHGWALDFGRIAKIWRAGCIIRAELLDAIKDAFEREQNLANLMLDAHFKKILADTLNNWRKVVAACVRLGVPTPALSSALNYFDSYRNERVWANMIQAQRDYFGAHTYERIDKEGSFHTEWHSLL